MLFFVRFSCHTGQVFILIFGKPDHWNSKTQPKHVLKVVLETRDIEDSATIFGFPVSNHKKSTALFKNISKFFFEFFFQ